MFGGFPFGAGKFGDAPFQQEAGGGVTVHVTGSEAQGASGSTTVHASGSSEVIGTEAKKLRRFFPIPITIFSRNRTIIRVSSKGAIGASGRTIVRTAARISVQGSMVSGRSTPVLVRCGTKVKIISAHSGHACRSTVQVRAIRNLDEVELLAIVDSL